MAKTRVTRTYELLIPLLVVISFSLTLLKVKLTISVFPLLCAYVFSLAKYLYHLNEVSKYVRNASPDIYEKNRAFGSRMISPLSISTLANRKELHSEVMLDFNSAIVSTWKAMAILMISLIVISVLSIRLIN